MLDRNSYSVYTDSCPVIGKNSLPGEIVEANSARRAQKGWRAVDKEATGAISVNIENGPRER